MNVFPYTVVKMAQYNGVWYMRALPYLDIPKEGMGMVQLQVGIM